MCEVTVSPNRPLPPDDGPTGSGASPPAPRRRGPLLALALGVLLVVAGVLTLLLPRGQEADDPAGGPVDARQMIDRVLAYGPDRAGVVYVDLAAAREAQGLAADADPAEVDSSEGPFRQAVHALPHLGAVGPPGPRVDSEAIDAGQVSAAATALGDAPGMTAIRTSQPFEEIAEVYLANGYEREGEAVVYRGEEPILPGYHYVVEDDGLVLLVSGRGGFATGIDPAAVLADAAGTPRGDTVGALLDQGALGVGLLWLPDGVPAPFDCVQAWGATTRFDAAEQDDAVLVAEEGRAADVTADAGRAFGDVYAFGQPRVDGDVISQSVTADPGTGAFGVFEAYPERVPGDTWACG